MNPPSKVLFVDDSEVDRLLISNILNELDIDFLACSTIQEFLARIKDYVPDLCIVDLNIERIKDGAILIKAIRNILGHSLPIIVVSADDSSEEILENLRLGANDFICKPVDKTLLSSKLSNYLTSDIIKSKALPLFLVPPALESSIAVSTNIVLLAINETGLEFTCNELNLNIGSTIKIENKLFADIFPSQEYLYLKVNDQVEGVFLSTFEDLSETDIHSIRKLILAKS